MKSKIVSLISLLLILQIIICNSTDSSLTKHSIFVDWNGECEESDSEDLKNLSEEQEDNEFFKSSSLLLIDLVTIKIFHLTNSSNIYDSKFIKIISPPPKA
jgi:hypothetical protein